MESTALEAVEKENISLRKQLAESQSELAASLEKVERTHVHETMELPGTVSSSVSGDVSMIYALMHELGAGQEFLCENGGALDNLTPLLMIYRAFKRHAIKNSCVENLSFWLEVEAFRMIQSQTHRDKRAQDLYSRFLKQSALEEVNLSSADRKATVKNLNPPVSPNAFDVAQKSVFRLLRTDTWRAFMRTELAADVMRLLRVTDPGDDADEGDDVGGEHADPSSSPGSSPYASADEEREFRSRFSVRDDEPLLYACSCVMDRSMLKVPVTGRLFVFERYWCFEGASFAVKHRVTIDATTVLDVQRNLQAEDYSITIHIPTRRSSTVTGNSGTDKVITIRHLDDRDAMIRSLKQSMRGNAGHRSTRPSIRVAGKGLPVPIDGANVSAESEPPQDALSEADWCQLLEGAQAKSFKKEQVVVAEGKSCEGLYSIEWGTVRVEKKSYKGDTVVLTRMGAGRIFGEISFAGTGEATATVIAEEDGVRIFVIETDYVASLLGCDPGLAARFYKYLGQKMAQSLQSDGAVIRDLRSKIKQLESTVENVTRMAECDDLSSGGARLSTSSERRSSLVSPAHEKEGDLSFARDLWDGYENARQRVEEGMLCLRDVVSTLQKRAEIEAEYGRKLSQLALAHGGSAVFGTESALTKAFGGAQKRAIDIETGSVRASWSVILESYAQFGRLHGDWANRLMGMLADCTAFLSQHEPVRRQLCTDYTAKLAEEASAIDNANRIKKVYHAAVKDAYSIGQKLLQELHHGKAEKATKLKDKAVRARDKALGMEREYRTALEEANRVRDSLMAFAFPTILNGLQEIEESRLRMLKTTFTRIVKAESNLSHFKGTADMHASVSVLDWVVDLQAFIRFNKSKAKRRARQVPFESSEFDLSSLIF